MRKLRHCVLLLAIAAIALPAHSETKQPVGHTDTHTVKTQSIEMISRVIPAHELKAAPVFKSEIMPAKNMRKTDSSARTHTVTLKQVFDENLYECIGIVRIVGEDFYLGTSTDDTYAGVQEGVAELPEGTYTFLSEFDVLDEKIQYGKRCNAWIVIENVKIDKDTTIEFKAADAKNLITCESLNPNGEVQMLPTIKYTPEGRENLEGNVSDLVIGNSISSKRFGPIYGRDGKCNYVLINENAGTSFNISRIMDIMINDVSDDICITQSRLASADDGFYFSFMKPINGVTESCEGAYSDNYSVKHTEKYIPSILNENSEENFSSPFSISYKFNYGWISNSSYSVESNCGLLQISGAEYLPDSYELGFLHSYVDFATPAFDEETGEEIGLMTYSFQSMPMYLSSDGSLCRTYEQHINGFKNTMNPNSTLPAMQHPAFSYDESQALILQGGTQPSILFDSYYNYDWMDEKWKWYIDALPMGRLGEFRISDIVSMGKSDEETNGLLTYSISTSNVNIYENPDGTGESFPGLTTASFTINPDVTINPPAVQQVQFRNTENMVTDRFKSQEDGLILIAAGGFKQKFSDEDEYHWWFDNCDVDITVEYSPMGENKWNEVAVTEQEDLFISQFGSFYAGSLDNVTEKSATGWYDLRISLADSDGATQMQTISPAFKIDGLTSVETVDSNSLRILLSDGMLIAVGNPEADITVTSANGSTVARGNGSIDTSSIPTGVYIVTATSDSGSVVKKIIL
jgi:hypothetical protein